MEPYSALRIFNTTQIGILSVDCLSLPSIVRQVPITSTAPLVKKKMTVLPPVGSVVSAKLFVDGARIIRGLDTGTRAFNNSVSMTICVPDAQGQPEKCIAFKLFRNKFQTTGAITLEHSLSAWETVRSKLLEVTDVGLTPEQLAELKVIDLRYVMVDVTFSFGYQINRVALRSLASTCLDHGFHVIWEPGVHPNGAIVKFPINEYQGVITKKKRKGVPPCVTFIVFSSGRCIISGPNHEHNEIAYNKFRVLMEEIRSEVEWKAVVD